MILYTSYIFSQQVFTSIQKMEMLVIELINKNIISEPVFYIAWIWIVFSLETIVLGSPLRN